MKEFPTDIQFKYSWRKYQERVLNELEEHLEDNHLHIIAPPGSGKTVLGLEVALRLNKPTLVLAPTIAIRNQWIQRFCELFLQITDKPAWISRDVRQPAFLTVVTYQSLHAACTGVPADDEEGEEELENDDRPSGKGSAKEVIRLLKAQDIGTIVVDEAHHLKNAWWQSLTEVKTALEPTIVGLTATPPYDVSHAEWQRYIELNGPVDAEISVPELVVEGDLCPHQDYVYLSKPTSDETMRIVEFRQRMEKLYNEIKTDKVLIEALESHPIFKDPTSHLDWIYSNLESYSAGLIFLKAVGIEITYEQLEVIGDHKFKVPQLSYEWMEILLGFYLFQDAQHFQGNEAHQEHLIRKLKRSGALDRRRVKLSHNSRINSMLGSSISKLKSIEEIVDFEHDHLKQELRLVILTDYIRKEFLTNESVNDLELNKIGVLPIFEQLRRTNDRYMKIGVLTGSLIIIPIAALEAFKQAASKYGISTVATSPLSYDDQYCIINSTEQLRHDMVHIVTQVFQAGHIEVLIGTKSLLGEGWDAPAINALILASFVGSYVLSNQMRGRAIRTNREQADKTGNIWHLVCTDLSANDGGDNLQLLKRRFKAFVGVSFRDEVTIENGIDRLQLPERFKKENDIAAFNRRMLEQAGQRDQLNDKWTEALAGGTLLVEEIKVPFPEGREYKEIKSLYYNKTIKNLLATLGSGFTTFIYEVLEFLADGLDHINDMEELMYLLMAVGGLGVLLFGRSTYKAARTYVKYRDISKDVHQIGEAILASLIKTKAIRTEAEKLTVATKLDEHGAIFCHLEGGTTFEKSTFIKSLHEAIGTVENPRYIILRMSFFLKVFSQKDFHSVPELLGRKKEHATFFADKWRQWVGACKLVYTRTLEGRKVLLKSRINSLASEFQDKSERINKWQ